MSNSSRVLKNTLSLYLRMIFLTVISLFTVRVVLNSLGVEDYGLYNVIAGFVSMFSFVSGTLTVASQRFFAIYIGRNDWLSVSKYFSVNCILYGLFCLVVLIFAETFGLWFILHKMIIPSDRLIASIWVYEFSILNFIFGLIISPYLALLVADENLALYSFVSVVEGIFKIAVAYVIYITTRDKLIIYGLLLLIITFLINIIYYIYCKFKYKQLILHLEKDKKIYKEVFSFLNWNMIGALASVGKNQGVNLLMNIFFGPVVNAARGVACQVSGVVSSFSVNFMKAIDPQITKNYAIGDTKAFFNITCTASKISYFLLFIFVVPLMANMEYVLTLWLKNVPEYTIIFGKLVLIDALIFALTDPISTAVQAIGKVKWYQIIVGGLYLLNVPFSYIFLKLSSNPLLPFYVCIVVSILMTIGKIIFFKILGNISILSYIKNVVIPAIFVTVLSFVFDYFVITPAEAFKELVFNVLIEVCVIMIFIFFIGFGKNERNIFLSCIPGIRKLIKRS